MLSCCYDDDEKKNSKKNKKKIGDKIVENQITNARLDARRQSQSFFIFLLKLKFVAVDVVGMKNKKMLFLIHRLAPKMGGGRFGPMVKKIGGEGILCLFCSFLFFVSNKNKKKKKTGGEQFQK